MKYACVCNAVKGFISYWHDFAGKVTEKSAFHLHYHCLASHFRSCLQPLITHQYSLHIILDVRVRTFTCAHARKRAYTHITHVDVRSTCVHARERTCAHVSSVFDARVRTSTRVHARARTSVTHVDVRARARCETGFRVNIHVYCCSSA
jgi:hypothetical protein